MRKIVLRPIAEGLPPAGESLVVAEIKPGARYLYVLTTERGATVAHRQGALSMLRSTVPDTKESPASILVLPHGYEFDVWEDDIATDADSDKS